MQLRTIGYVRLRSELSKSYLLNTAQNIIEACSQTRFLAIPSLYLAILS